MSGTGAVDFAHGALTARSAVRRLGYVSIQLVLIILASASAVNAAHAEIQKNIYISSSPPGAQIFLLRGSRREPLGTTPMHYQATFHSEMSILRILITKPGFTDKKLEISAKDKRVSVKLSRATMVAAPESLSDKGLRAVQSAIAARLKKAVPKLLRRQRPYPFDLNGPLAVVRINKSIYLRVSVLIDKPKPGVHAPGPGQLGEFSRAVWNQLGNAVVLPLARSLKDERRIAGVFLDVDYTHTEPGFKVGVRTESRVEMECVGGTKMQSVYDSCATREAVSTFGGRYLEYRCRPGYVTKPVYDPCASRVPVTRTEFKADPRALVNSGQSRLRYLVGTRVAAGAASAESIGERVGLVILDNRGEVIRSGTGIPGRTNN